MTNIMNHDPQGGMDCLQVALGSQPHWDVFFVDAQADFKLGVVEMVEIVEIVNANVKQDHICQQEKKTFKLRVSTLGYIFFCLLSNTKGKIEDSNVM